MDDLSGVVMKELEYDAGAWVSPLIQSGAWLEGTHLVTSALRKEDRYDQADKLLKQTYAVNYFLRFVRHEGRSKAPDAVINKLEATLLNLKEIVNKEQISPKDVDEMNRITKELLQLL